jgi:hypothetical protein
MYYIPGPHGNLNKLPNLAPIAKAETETEFTTRVVVIREETLMVNKMPTTTKNCQRYCSEKYEFCELASVDKSATEDEMISNAAVFKDTVSHQSSDGNLYYVNHILAEKHENGSIYYLIL